MTIEPHRKIGDPGSEYAGLNGQGIIARLLQLQNPEYATRKEREKFDKINHFIQSVTGARDAHLEVPHSGKELLVEIDGRLLPIEQLGTGIHEVVIFAAAAVAHEDVFMCLEEPEIHLHPRLQKRLMSFLRDETNNTYFITTHSAHLLDTSGSTVFHVQLNEHNETEVQPISTPNGRAHICFDLGYRPSDLVQSNCIIWVEGPSDRIYLKNWIRSLDETLIEGEHYSIMFYGGRLLAHLSVVDDQEVGDFIQLQRLNRRVAILIDSDLNSRVDSIRPTKQRVIEEIANHGGFAWVTAGREVENYVDQVEMVAALAKIHPQTEFKNNSGQWKCVYETKSTGRNGADKMAIAKHLCQKSLRLDILDLADRIDELVKYIRASNI
jgi:hypothetical protein